MQLHSSVSVIIPTYNRANSVPRAIESVLNQTMPVSEIIVVDDGSRDNTREVIHSYKPRIKYIYQNNAGPAAARNRGIAESKCRWLAFLDSDDIWLPQKIERQLQETEKLGADVSFHDLHLRRNNNEAYVESWNREVNRHCKNLIPLGTGIIEDAYSRCMLCGHLFLTTTLMLNKYCLDSLGLFKEELRTSEDLELYFRLATKYKIAYLNEQLALYDPGTERVTNYERVYKDRIKAINISLIDQIKSNNRHNIKIARCGLQQHMRSLAGAYRRDHRYYSSLKIYIKLIMHNILPKIIHYK
jgi:glycosyltransferase involved in cell wall biosynthesis